MSTTTSARLTSSSGLLAGLAAALLAAGARADVLHVPGDFPTVAEALAAAQAGDEVVLAAGSYNVPIEMNLLSDIVLRGKGKVVLGGGTALTPALTLTHCTNVTVEHLRIEGALGVGVLLGPECELVTLSRVRVLDPAGVGIVAGESGDVLLDRCRVERAGGSGIDAGVKSGSFTLSRCTIIDAAAHGISLGDLSDSVVDRCHVSGSGANGIALGFTDPVSTCVASRNVVLDSGDRGIFVRGPDNVLVDNRVERSLTNGIEVFSTSPGCIVQDNRLLDNTTGIDASGTGVLVRDNRVIGSEQLGIVLRADDCVVEDNRVVKPGTDAYLWDNTIEGGAILGNKAKQAGEDGFDIRGNFLSITDNSSVGAGSDGFEMVGADGVLTGNSAHGSDGFDLDNLGAGNVYLDNDFGTID